MREVGSTTDDVDDLTMAEIYDSFASVKKYLLLNEGFGVTS